MDPSLSSILWQCLAIVVIMLAAWQYFLRVRMNRPPVGVLNLRDIVITFVMLVGIPPLYLEIPTWSVAAIMVPIATGLAYMTVSVAFGRLVGILAAGGLTVGEVTLTAWGYGQSTGFVALNDIAVGALVVGVCNIWAQSGIRARDVAVFGCLVAGYDLVATWLMPLMTDFFTRVSSMPFAPMLAIGTGPDAAVIGMGDLLFIVLWPLVALKAYSGRAGLFAATGTVGCVAALGAAFYLDVFNAAVPAMVFLGPVILVQFLVLRRLYGTERTTGQYQAATRPDAPPVRVAPAPPARDLTVALGHLSSGDRPGHYLALHEGAVIATGTTPGAATIAAGKAAPAATPVLVLGDVRARQPACRNPARRFYVLYTST